MHGVEALLTSRVPEIDLHRRGRWGAGESTGEPIRSGTPHTPMQEEVERNDVGAASPCTPRRPQRRHGGRA
eukprot:scaffold274917_cov32-Tisochrysis_lutea.AAC.3